MCIQLEQAINKRFSGIVKRLFQQTVSIDDPFSDPVYFICAVLDPEFKFLWLSQMNYKPTIEAKMKQSLIQMILDECEQYTDSSSENIPHTQSSSSPSSLSNSYTTQSINTLTIKKRKLFHYDDDSTLSFISSINPSNEINIFINDPVRFRFSSYWKNSRLYSLKNVVNRVFSIQASSAPIERIFSQAGVIMSPRRTSMSEEVFRSLVFLRVNQDLI
jgi:hypothetical protein